MTTTEPPTTHPDDDVRSGVWAAVPRGAQLDARSFAARHRVTTGVLAAHVPALVLIGLARGTARSTRCPPSC